MRHTLLHFLMVLIIAVVAILGYGLWYNIVSGKSTEVANLQNQITIATDSVNHMNADRAALTEITNNEAQIQSYFVPESDVVGFINNLEANGRTQKVSITVLSVSTNHVATLPVLQLALTIKGTFDSVMRMVGIIEYAPYDLSISALSVKQDGKNSWEAALTFSVGSIPAVPTPKTP